MRLRAGVLVLVSFLAVSFLVGDLRAGDFVSGVTNYTEGSFATVGGQHFTTTSTAVGKPSPIVGAGSAGAGILSGHDRSARSTMDN